MLSVNWNAKLIYVITECTGVYQYVNTWLALVLQTLTCCHESLSILEVSEQAITGTEWNN